MARRLDGVSEAEREAEREAAEVRARAEEARQDRLKELDRKHESLMDRLGRPFEELFRRRHPRSGKP